VENEERHVQMIRILAGESKKQVLIASALRNKEFSAHNAVYFWPLPLNVFDGPIEIKLVNAENDLIVSKGMEDYTHAHL
jgi:hypothetical protein